MNILRINGFNHQFQKLTSALDIFLSGVNGSQNVSFAAIVLSELEAWAKEPCYSHAVLETSRSMAAAIGFYRKNGYLQILNYGPYQIFLPVFAKQRRLGVGRADGLFLGL